jgi:hypothetical protein
MVLDIVDRDVHISERDFGLANTAVSIRLSLGTRACGSPYTWQVSSFRGCSTRRSLGLRFSAGGPVGIASGGLACRPNITTRTCDRQLGHKGSFVMTTFGLLKN